MADATKAEAGPADAGPADAMMLKPAFRLTGRLVATLRTADPADFRTHAVESLPLAGGGIEGDRHFGFTRRSGGREPWYPRGTEIANPRSLTVLSAEELAETAAALGLPGLDAAWYGANLVVEGVANLSWLPRGTRIAFAGGASMLVCDQNAPCRITGRAIAEATDRPDVELAFPRVARRLRGLIGWVDRPGTVAAGEGFTAFVPEQWVYAPPR
ncbi:molybdenum cofactor sulfurase [Pseudoxanthobacter sp.]|uniref:MOSC domain-containing protein n=1 Tax=Pseudoxanthobacter sp. TaxID=1925742 RepID=UPI002FE3841B